MTPRKRRMMLGFAALALAVWFILIFILVISNNVQTAISVQPGEALADVTLGDLQCKKTFSQAFPFFEMACEEVESIEVAP